MQAYEIQEHIESNYQSCIVINGRRILPPVVSNEMRAEMQAYKEIAIDIENRLAENRRIQLLREIKCVTEKVQALNVDADEESKVNHLKSMSAMSNKENSNINSKWSLSPENKTKALADIRSLPSELFKHFKFNPILQKDITNPIGNQSAIPVAMVKKSDLITLPQDGSVLHSAPPSSVASTELAKYMYNYEIEMPNSRLSIHSHNCTEDKEAESCDNSASSVSTLLFNSCQETPPKEKSPSTDIEGTPKSEMGFERKHVRKLSYTLETPSPALASKLISEYQTEENECSRELNNELGKLKHMEFFLKDVSNVPIAWKDTNETSGITNSQSEEVVTKCLFDADLKNKFDNSTYLLPLNKMPQTALVADEKIKLRYNKLSALAKGFLTRRLMKTKRVQDIIKTIQDTLTCAFDLQLESPLKKGNVTEQDVELHKRLLLQLSGACYELHKIFINFSSKERMEIISRDRELIKKELKNSNSAKNKIRLSLATEKAIERRSKSQFTLRFSTGSSKHSFSGSRRSPKGFKSVKRVTSASPQLQKYVAESYFNNSPKEGSRRSVRSLFH